MSLTNYVTMTAGNFRELTAVALLHPFDGMSQQSLHRPGGIGAMAAQQVGNGRADEMPGYPERLAEQLGRVIRVEAFRSQAQEIAPIELGDAGLDAPGRSALEHMGIDEQTGQPPERTVLFPAGRLRLPERRLPGSVRPPHDLPPDPELGQVSLPVRTGLLH